MNNQPGTQPLDLSIWLRDHPATQKLTTVVFTTLQRIMDEELELWVGKALFQGLPDTQMDEFDAIADIDGAKIEWLASNIPNYTQTVETQIAGFLAQTTDLLTRLKNAETDPTWGLELSIRTSEYLGLQENRPAPSLPSASSTLKPADGAMR